MRYSNGPNSSDINVRGAFYIQVASSNKCFYEQVTGYLRYTLVFVVAVRIVSLMSDHLWFTLYSLSPLGVF